MEDLANSDKLEKVDKVVPNVFIGLGDVAVRCVGYEHLCLVSVEEVGDGQMNKKAAPILANRL